jgi:hypothetical protein
VPFACPLYYSLKPTSHPLLSKRPNFTSRSSDANPTDNSDREKRRLGKASVAITASKAGQLAYYESQGGLGVLAPSGWHCCPRTPANTEGLGTYSGLKANASPIKGVAMLLGDTPNLMRLAIRLSPGKADLAPRIIQQAEKDAGKCAP